MVDEVKRLLVSEVVLQVAQNNRAILVVRGYFERN